MLASFDALNFLLILNYARFTATLRIIGMVTGVSISPTMLTVLQLLHLHSMRVDPVVALKRSQLQLEHRFSISALFIVSDGNQKKRCLQNYFFMLRFAMGIFPLLI